jgi:hypothetical protein
MVTMAATTMRLCQSTLASGTHDPAGPSVEIPG